MRRRAAAALLLLGTGCATSVGSVGFIGQSADALDVKMLRPGARARACRASVFGVALGSAEPALHDAVGQLLALDSEGDLLTNVEITTRTLTTGVYNRRCVELRGDLVRRIPSITIPMSGHAGH